MAWLQEERGLSPETLAQLDVADGITFFPDIQKNALAIFFGYAEGWKARAWPESVRFRERVCPLILEP